MGSPDIPNGFPSLRPRALCQSPFVLSVFRRRRTVSKNLSSVVSDISLSETWSEQIIRIVNI